MFAGIVGLCLAVGSAFAQASDACQPFSVSSDGSQRSVTFVDAGGDGPGPGDQRIGSRALSDDDGQHAGSLHWIRTVLVNAENEGGDGEHISSIVLALHDGQIYITSHSVAQNPAQDLEQPSFSDQPSGVVTGGTGAYTFARGVAEYRFENGILTYDVNIRCD